MSDKKLESLALRMQRLKRQFREAQQEHDQRESRRAFRAVRKAGLTAADVERLLAQMTQVQPKEVSDGYADHGQAQ